MDGPYTDGVMDASARWDVTAPPKNGRLSADVASARMTVEPTPPGAAGWRPRNGGGEKTTGPLPPPPPTTSSVYSGSREGLID